MKKERGFTIPEVLVAMMIFTIMIVGVTPSIMLYSKLNTRNAVRSAAMATAQGSIDALRVADPGSFPSSGTVTKTTSVDGFPLTVQTIYCPAGTTYCNATTTRHVRVNVRWNNQDIYEVETVFTDLD